jgi:RNA polymerase sigma-70 factor (ECF subfamily)
MNDPVQDDVTLISLIAHGRTDALDELYNRYSRLVFSIAFTLVNDRATAGEITLDVFTHVWQRAETYRAERARVRTWLAAISRNRAIDILRKQNVRPDYSNSVSWDTLFPPPAIYDLEDEVDLSLQRERIRAAVAQLPAEQQQVLALAYFKGYTQQQIAETLGQPLGTIKTRIRLAMQKLRQILQEERPSSDESYPIKKAADALPAYLHNKRR